MKPTTIVSLMMLIAGIIFYLFWSLHYDAWTDIGVYTVTIPLVVFGVLGLLLCIQKEGGVSQEKRKKIS